MNVVLVGTKLDLLTVKGHRQKNREVTREEAVAFAERMNLVGFIETTTLQKQKKEDINDCFRILAINHFDKTSPQMVSFVAGVLLLSEKDRPQSSYKGCKLIDECVSLTYYN